MKYYIGDKVYCKILGGKRGGIYVITKILPPRNGLLESYALDKREGGQCCAWFYEDCLELVTPEMKGIPHIPNTPKPYGFD